MNELASGRRRRESLGEQIANAATHGIGAALAVAGLILLVILASLHGTLVHIISMALYGTTLVLLYVASTIYHAVRGPRARSICRVLDHAAIFLLIAGTYSPFALVGLGGVWGWSLFVIIWALAITGVLFKLFHKTHTQRTSLILYLAMSWLFIVALGELTRVLAPGALLWLLIGGFAYTGGILFFVWERMPFHHAVWHLFVLAGSACHFAAIVFYLLPNPAI